MEHGQCYSNFSSAVISSNNRPLSNKRPPSNKSPYLLGKICYSQESITRRERPGTIFVSQPFPVSFSFERYVSRENTVSAEVRHWKCLLTLSVIVILNWDRVIAAWVPTMECHNCVLIGCCEVWAQKHRGDHVFFLNKNIREKIDSQT